MLIRGKFSDCVFMTHVEVDGGFFKYFWVSKVDLYIDLYINVVCSCSNFLCHVTVKTVFCSSDFEMNDKKQIPK